MFGMFWIALELSSSMMGLIIRLSLTVNELTASRNVVVGKCGNAGASSLPVQCYSPFNCLAICRRAPNHVTPYTVVITVCLMTFLLTKPSKSLATCTPCSASLCLLRSTCKQNDAYKYPLDNRYLRATLLLHVKRYGWALWSRSYDSCYDLDHFLTTLRLRSLERKFSAKENFKT